MLFAFIIVIIAVLLFSVVWVITVYLAGPQPGTWYPTTIQQQELDAAAQQAIQEALNASGTITITDDEWNPVQAVVGTGS